MPTIHDTDTSYTGAWNEVVLRVIARDTVIIGYVAICGALLGASVKSEGISALVLAVPIVTLVAGAFVAHHDFLISMINRYLKEFKSPGFEPWHRRHLKEATAGGLILHTLPAVVASGVLTWISIGLGASVVILDSSSSLSLLRYIGPVAGWLGTSLFVLGRGFQLWAAWRRAT